MMEFLTFPDCDAMTKAVAAAMETALRQRLSQPGTVSLALSGGRTPGPIYETLSSADLDWSRVTVTLSDDREVPPTSPYSNAKLVRETLLKGAAARARFVPLQAGPVDPALLPFEIVLLGMGEDGHTASLFPGAKGLAEALDPDAEPQCVVMTPVPLPVEAPYPRLSLTLPAILSARQILLLLVGEAKKKVFEKACEDGPATSMPIRAILRQSRVPLTVYWAP
jgi:6-phosphogluconolactonase